VVTTSNTVTLVFPNGTTTTRTETSTSTVPVSEAKGQDDEVRSGEAVSSPPRPQAEPAFPASGSSDIGTPEQLAAMMEAMRVMEGMEDDSVGNGDNPPTDEELEEMGGDEWFFKDTPDVASESPGAGSSIRGDKLVPGEDIRLDPEEEIVELGGDPWFFIKDD